MRWKENARDPGVAKNRPGSLVASVVVEEKQRLSARSLLRSQFCARRSDASCPMMSGARQESDVPSKPVSTLPTTRYLNTCPPRSRRRDGLLWLIRAIDKPSE